MKNARMHANGSQSSQIMKRYLQRYCSMGRLPSEGGIRPQKLFDPSDSVPKFFIFEIDEGMLPVRLLSMTSNNVRVRA